MALLLVRLHQGNDEMRESVNRGRVRRQSLMRGRCEPTVWRPVRRDSLRATLVRARRFDLAGRGAGRRNGPLGHIAIEVLDLLCNLVDYSTGRLEPSLQWLCMRLHRSRDAVVRALAALRRHGFIGWVRRAEPVEGQGAGPRLRQVSNAYWIVAASMHPGVPDDVVQAQDDRRRWIAALPAVEFVRALVQDEGLSAALERMAMRLSERESVTRGGVMS